MWGLLPPASFQLLFTRPLGPLPVLLGPHEAPGGRNVLLILQMRRPRAEVRRLPRAGTSPDFHLARGRVSCSVLSCEMLSRLLHCSQPPPGKGRTGSHFHECPGSYSSVEGSIQSGPLGALTYAPCLVGPAWADSLSPAGLSNKDVLSMQNECLGWPLWAPRPVTICFDLCLLGLSDICLGDFYSPMKLGAQQTGSKKAMQASSPAPSGPHRTPPHRSPASRPQLWLPRFLSTSGAWLMSSLRPLPCPHRFIPRLGFGESNKKWVRRAQPVQTRILISVKDGPGPRSVMKRMDLS